MIDKLLLVFQLWHAFICILQIYICLNMCYIEEVFLALCNSVRNLICAKIRLNDFSLPKEDGKGCRNVQRLFCYFQNSLVYDNGYIFFILCHLDSSAFSLFRKKYSIFCMWQRHVYFGLFVYWHLNFTIFCVYSKIWELFHSSMFCKTERDFRVLVIYIVF